MFRSVQVESPDCVIPARSAGIQVNMDVSGRILRIWMPAIHAGMTLISFFHVFWASVKIMNHFVRTPKNWLWGCDYCPSYRFLVALATLRRTRGVLPLTVGGRIMYSLPMGDIKDGWEEKHAFAANF
ncbi:MAG TPA: hypothetical protein VEG60_07790 [Candidatus Binatia bacterium]|nr:hypothetical protein [Candidatus Binatia bacterium]